MAELKKRERISLILTLDRKPEQDKKVKKN